MRNETLESIIRKLEEELRKLKEENEGLLAKIRRIESEMVRR